MVEHLTLDIGGCKAAESNGAGGTEGAFRQSCDSVQRERDVIQSDICKVAGEVERSPLDAPADSDLERINAGDISIDRNVCGSSGGVFYAVNVESNIRERRSGILFQDDGDVVPLVIGETGRTYGTSPPKVASDRPQSSAIRIAVEAKMKLSRGNVPISPRNDSMVRGVVRSDPEHDGAG